MEKRRRNLANCGLLSNTPAHCDAACRGCRGGPRSRAVRVPRLVLRRRRRAHARRCRDRPPLGTLPRCIAGEPAAISALPIRFGDLAPARARRPGSRTRSLRRPAPAATAVDSPAQAKTVPPDKTRRRHGGSGSATRTWTACHGGPPWLPPGAQAPTDMLYHHHITMTRILAEPGPGGDS